MKNVLSTHRPRSFVVMVLALIFCFASAGFVRATDYTVTSLTDTNSTGGGVGSGAAGDLRYCVTQANNGATGNVHTIAFGVTGTITLAGHELVINTNLTITGPGADKLTLNANQASRVFYIFPGHTINVSGLTLSNGNGNKNDATGTDKSDNGHGGAVLNDGSILNLSFCTVSKNGTTSTFVYGAGVLNQAINADAILTLSNCTISDNAADGSGVGIRNYSDGFTATLIVSDCLISNNSTSYHNGGGIDNEGNASNATISRCTISNNLAAYGGGICSNCRQGSRIVVRNCIVSGNAANYGGGGIQNMSGSTMTLLQCAVANNRSAEEGGGISNYNDTFDTATLTVRACTINGNNNAATSGGGLFNFGRGISIMHVSDSTIAGNSAQQGGGICNQGVGSGTPAVLTVANTTITANSAQQRGGGLYNYSQYGKASAVLANATVCGNSALGGAGIANDVAQNTGVTASLTISNTILALNPNGADFASLNGTAISNGYNLFDDHTGDTFLTAAGDLRSIAAGLEVDALNAPLLKDNGGLTQTVALLANSPALDAGKAAVDPAAGTATTRDQRGYLRPFNLTTVANAAGGDGSDIGAFESGSSVPPAPVIVSPASATGQAGVTFSLPIVASNSPISFDVTGLPAGLNVDFGTGVIFGTPVVSGTFPLAVSATNAGGTGNGSLTLSIQPAGPNPVITSPASVIGAIGVAFNFQVIATHSPKSYAASNLPAGLRIDQTTGLISGVPTTAGFNTATITATNASGSGSASLAINIQAGAPVITSPTAASGGVGSTFSYQITATNSPTGFGATGLSSGLNVDAVSGLIFGIPTRSGTFSVVLSATNAIASATATLTLTVAPPPPAPVITSPTVSAANVGSPFMYQITATNSPTSFGAVGLPDGLNLNTANGLISGTPTQQGDSTITLSAVNAGGLGQATLSLSVGPALPVATLTAVTTNVTVGSGDVGEFVVSLSEPAEDDLIVGFTIKGTAVNGQDYVFLKSTKKLKAGKTSKVIKIEPLGNLGGAAKKTVKLTLISGDGYALGASSPVKVKILANSARP